MDNVPWYENDDLWETMTPFFFSEERWAGTPKEVDQIIQLLDLSEGDAILDLCCGPGGHSLELARRHFRVTGVDRTTSYLEEAQNRAESEGLPVEFIHEDKRRFCRSDAFDGALLLFSSFGYFEDPADNRQVLCNVYCSLKKGGRLIMDLMGKEVISRVFQERDWGERDGIINLAERRVSEGWSKMENRWIIINGKTRKEFKFSHWIYSAKELSNLLKECGFSFLEVYGDFEGNLYDHTAKRLVVVAQK